MAKKTKAGKKTKKMHSAKTLSPTLTTRPIGKTS
jgi:hypothetical protein